VGAPKSVVDLLTEARAHLERISAGDARSEQEQGAMLVDTRTHEQLAEGGTIPGALVIGLNVLEWRLDPTSPSRIPEATGHDLRVIVLCQGGFSSSLAAARLQELGLSRATDVVGGFEAWRDAGLPVERR
jgi:rhodanese-related sulfurtransferase